MMGPNRFLKQICWPRNLSKWIQNISKSVPDGSKRSWNDFFKFSERIPNVSKRLWWTPNYFLNGFSDPGTKTNDRKHVKRISKRSKNDSEQIVIGSETFRNEPQRFRKHSHKPRKIPKRFFYLSRLVPDPLHKQSKIRLKGLVRFVSILFYFRTNPIGFQHVRKYFVWTHYILKRSFSSEK